MNDMAERAREAREKVLEACKQSPITASWNEPHTWKSPLDYMFTVVCDAPLGRIFLSNPQATVWEAWIDAAARLVPQPASAETVADPVAKVETETDRIREHCEQHRWTTYADTKLILNSVAALQSANAELQSSLDRAVRELSARADRLKTARSTLQSIADCDWFITLPDRMDAVRSMANDALAATAPPADAKEEAC